MSVYYVIFPIIIISLTLIFSGLINITYGQVSTNLTGKSIENNLNGLQILSHNSFTDSIGYLHVVGEIKNNYRATATFVRIVGTFYDINNQVVGTQFTYANPSDIGSGRKGSVCINTYVCKYSDFSIRSLQLTSKLPINR